MGNIGPLLRAISSSKLHVREAEKRRLGMHSFLRRLPHTKYSRSSDTRLLVYERERAEAYRVDAIFLYKLLEGHPQRLERR